MDSILDCFGDIVGLATGSDTDSGLYISDLEAVSTIQGLVIEEAKTVAEIMGDARRVAILALNADLTALMTKYARVRKPFRGKIGNSRWVRKQAGGAELVILCRPLPNATMTIDNIGLLMANAGVQTVEFTSNIGHSETFDIDCTAERLTIEPNIGLTNLPLYSQMVDLVEYRFSHDADYCHGKLQGCGSCSFKFNYHRPRFTQHGLSSYVAVAGYRGGQYLNTSAGIVLSADIRCRIDNFVCDQELDYEVSPVAQAYAQAVQYKAGSVVVWNCLRNPNLNRVLMQDAEDMRDAARYYERRYRDMVQFINKNQDYDHDCVCSKGRSWTGQRG